MVKHVAAGFSRTTEDGTCFRIYNLGSLEVRTIQEPGSEETAGAVFSSQAEAPTSAQGNWSTVAKTDKVVKAVLYVEHNAEAEGGRFFTLLETDQSDSIMVETLPDGSLSWVESSEVLEARKAQAKVLRAAECSDAGMTVQEFRARLSEVAATGNGLHCMEVVLMLVLPAREKAWAALSQSELMLAKELGISSARGWDERESDVFGLGWDSLSKEQRVAAEGLGFDKASWRSSAPTGNQAKSLPARAELSVAERVESMTEAEQEALMEEWVKQTYGIGAEH